MYKTINESSSSRNDIKGNIIQELMMKIILELIQQMTKLIESIIAMQDIILVLCAIDSNSNKQYKVNKVAEKIIQSQNNIKPSKLTDDK